jgi:hypothetical protein
MTGDVFWSGVWRVFLDEILGIQKGLKKRNFSEGGSEVVGNLWRLKILGLVRREVFRRTV